MRKSPNCLSSWKGGRNVSVYECVYSFVSLLYQQKPWPVTNTYVVRVYANIKLHVITWIDTLSIKKITHSKTNAVVKSQSHGHLNGNSSCQLKVWQQKWSVSQPYAISLLYLARICRWHTDEIIWLILCYYHTEHTWKYFTTNCN